ncbi:Hypothetical predicted protein [Octopus vulgaris]|uniref:Uncharacterized protein n=1 Tax=Octopus vulgaris TaxID=6645 RepID=A0AA36EZ72_OCTVU|nr:Hypothetical predicted protein [Octopus vulgaris]
MKRIKDNGAAFRKKKKREEERRNEGAIIKFLIKPDRLDETGITVEGLGDDDVNEVQLEKMIEDEVDEADPPPTTEEQSSNINLKDIGM